MTQPSALILIPARYASSRFPGKPLASLGNKSMIQQVYENAKDSGFDACVVTDDQRIEDHVKGFSGVVCRVDDPVESGSERILLAYQRFYQNKKYDLIINVQGDEPLLLGEDLKELANYHLNSPFDIATIVKEFLDEEGFRDPNRVKAAYTEKKGQCLYFSRSSIPFDREGMDKKWYLHIGVYSYRPEALEAFGKEPQSYFEKKERLEQLRALEMGLTIGAITTKRELLGVDTPEDLEKLRRVLSGKGK